MADMEGMEDEYDPWDAWSEIPEESIQYYIGKITFKRLLVI